MPNLSKQFVFTVADQPSTTIPGDALSPDGDRTFYSIKEQGDGYYNQGDGIHTVSYTVAPGYAGILNIQATLALDPANNDWFDIPETTRQYSENSITTTTNYVNFTGNFVWVRAKVTRTNDDLGTFLQVINFNH